MTLGLRPDGIDGSELLLHTVDAKRLIDAEHAAHGIEELVGRLGTGLYPAQIAAVEGHARQEHPQPGRERSLGS